MRDRTSASVYRALQEQSLFRKEDIDSVAVYYYSSELATFNMRSSKYRDRHNVREHTIIMSIEDLAANVLVRLMIEYGLLDLDTIVLNQIAFTFYRQTGFMFRNDTSETWYWDRSQESYSAYAPSLKYDFHGNAGAWLASIAIGKIVLVI